MKIRILGPGCANCRTLASRTEAAAQELGLDATVEKVESPRDIAAYGILRTPGLVLDETVVCQGRVPRVEEIKSLLKDHAAKDLPA
ncbi:MAG: thioredoxin family protein [Bacteroidota bacterium]